MDEAKARLVERLIKDCGERAFHFAWRLSGDSESAKELVQEAYRRVLAKWERYDSRQPLENWFFSVLRHICIDAAKRVDRTRTVSLEHPAPGTAEFEGLPLAERIADRTEPIETQLERRESGEVVHRALKALSYDHRVVLVLCDMEGMGYDDIAEVLGCAVGTVRSRVSRARVAMRRALRDRVDEAGVTR
ncbi:MAG: RNA polymerase sigma factor [Elusimicrobia bacterium]|nr:RNA polymerase sigma factor [Elusimicrobiota bacterium]